MTSVERLENGLERTGWRGLIRRHPLLAFVVITYAFAWLTVTPYLLSVRGVITGNYLLLWVVHVYASTVAAVTVISVSEGRPGLALLRASLRWRNANADGRLLVLVVVVMPALFVAAMLVQPGVAVATGGLTPALLISYPVFYAATFFGGGPLGECIGWRGFALPRLQSRFSPLAASALLGLLWAFWHTPDFFFSTAQGASTDTSLTTYLVNIPIFLLLVQACSIVLTWVFNVTKGSIFMAALAHTGIDAPQAAFVPSVLVLDMTSLNVAALIAFGGLALVIVVLTRGQLGLPPVTAAAAAGGRSASMASSASR